MTASPHALVERRGLVARADRTSIDRPVASNRTSNRTHKDAVVTKKKQNARDAWVDAILSPECDVPSAARLTAIALSRFMDWDTLGNAYPGPDRLARMTGRHISTVKEHLKQLCELEWLTQTMKGGSRRAEKREASVYQGRYPSHWATGTPNDPSHTAQQPVAESATTRSTTLGDPSQKTTPPFQGPGQRPGQGNGARTRTGAREGSPRPRAPRETKNSDVEEGAAVLYDIVDGKPVRRNA
jgi:hypothetical protein